MIFAGVKVVIHKDKYRLVGQLNEVFLFDEALSPRQLMDLGLWAQGREKTMD